MKHTLSNSKVYPMRHFWATASKLNLHSHVDINKGDEIHVESVKMTVLEVKDKKPSQVVKGAKFYELDVKKL